MPGDRLADVQAQLYDLITAPEGVGKRLTELGRTPRDLETIVRSSGQLSAVERVDVYANMYFFRILEVLGDEYAKIVTLMGGDAFHNLVTDYLLACRPAHPSLREVGARLPAYLATHPLAEDRPWLSELARLDRLRLELFDGPDAATLTLDQVRALPPEALPELALRAVPCHAVVHAEYAIAALWRAFEGRTDEGPPLGDPPKSAQTILIWRQELTVFHRVLDPDEWLCLPLLRRGAIFADVCEQVLEARKDPEAAAARAFELLVRWLADGTLAAAGSDR